MHEYFKGLLNVLGLLVQFHAFFLESCKIPGLPGRCENPYCKNYPMLLCMPYE